VTRIPVGARRRICVALPLGVCIAALALASTARAEVEKFDPAVARRITVGDLKKRMDGGEKIVILDVRGVTSGTVIKSAIQVPKGQTGAVTEKLPRDTLIICYCS
jgi:hypothetical protein